MKRFLIFALLGPLLGALVMMLVVLPLAGWREGLGFKFDQGHLLLLVVAVPLGYVVGIVPALLVATLDWCLKGAAWRVAWSALAGGVACLLIPLVFKMGQAGPFIMGLGLVGAVPAAVCSWLSRETTRDEPDSRDAGGLPSRLVREA